MKKNKAFTLIELLAVIIILAAIALIIAPLVLDIIREQQKKTFKESINGILRSSRLEIVNSGLSFPATFTYSDGKLLSPTGKELKVTGKIPEGSGSVRYNSEDDIELAIHDNAWCGTYNKSSKEVDVNELDGECSFIAHTPEKCFQVEEYQDITYTINYNACVDYMINTEGHGEENAKRICNDESDEANDDTLTVVIEDEVSESWSIDELEEAGVVTAHIEKDSDAVTITKYNKSDQDCPVDVVIPNQIQGKKVKKIGPTAFIENWDGSYDNIPDVGDSKKINSVVLPSYLEIIDRNAFSGIPYGYDDIVFNQITDVDFSKAKNLKKIKHEAFLGNKISQLSMQNLGALEYIGFCVFELNSFSSVDLSNDANLEIIARGAFSEAYAEDGLKKLNMRKVKKLRHVGQFNFSAAGIVELDITGMTTIFPDMFSDNHITNLTIPNSVTSIGYSAFWSNKLVSVTIPDSVTSIGDAAFNENQLPDNQAFIYARNNDGSVNNTIVVSYGGLKRDNVIIPSTVTSIGDYAFSDNGLTSVTIPNSVTSIGWDAFSFNNLTSVVIPESVMSIGNNAFRWNYLTSVTIKGKNSKSDFTSYPSSSPFGWASGYSDSNIIWNG